jgi:GNAT superfamily N-acetyltransferase
MFDGVDSPCTQTFGLGMFANPSDRDLETLERFFHERGAAVCHEICPIAGVRLLPMLNARGYRPIEISNVLFLALPGKADPPGPPSTLQARVVGEQEHDLWAATAAEGWREAGDFRELMRASAARRSGVDFLVEWEGSPIAAASLVIHEGVALMAGASTIPCWRGRGAQQALFRARLAYAAGAGCELAMVVTEPGSASERNAQRYGFQVAYTRTKWMLPAPGR